MASQPLCVFCGSGMDPRDGHRECPACLGRAHLLNDVEDPCPAAVGLPLEERARRAGRPVAAQPAEKAPRTHSRGRERSSDGQTLKRKQKHPHRASKRRATEDPHPCEDKSGEEELQLQLLAAIRGLSDTLTNWEPPAAGAAQVGVSSVSSRLEGSREASPEHLPSYQETGSVLADAISLHAQGSLLGRDMEESGSIMSSGLAEGSASVEERDETGAGDLVSTVLSAAKIVGLNILTDTPSTAEGVWAGISQPKPTTSIPATDDYCQMLKRAWHAPCRTPQYNAGCRKLAKAAYPLETGLGNVPPVEKDMAAMTSLCPTRLTADPHCPNRECDRSDRLVCKTYDAAARAARSGNALALLLAAIRKTSLAESQDTRNLVDAALSAHAQLTRDIGAAMSSAILARRQIWLAQTGLPDGIKRELTNMPVEPGRVFHGESQNFLERAEHSFRARESVNRTFRRPMFGARRQQQAYPTPPARRAGWQGVAGQRSNPQSFDGTATRAWRGQPRSATRRSDRGRLPPRGPRTRGGPT